MQSFVVWLSSDPAWVRTGLRVVHFCGLVLGVGAATLLDLIVDLKPLTLKVPTPHFSKAMCWDFGPGFYRTLPALSAGPCPRVVSGPCPLTGPLKTPVMRRTIHDQREPWCVTLRSKALPQPTQSMTPTTEATGRKDLITQLRRSASQSIWDVVRREGAEIGRDMIATFEEIVTGSGSDHIVAQSTSV